MPGTTTVAAQTAAVRIPQLPITRITRRMSSVVIPASRSAAVGSGRTRSGSSSLNLVLRASAQGARQESNWAPTAAAPTRMKAIASSQPIRAMVTPKRPNSWV